MTVVSRSSGKRLKGFSNWGGLTGSALLAASVFCAAPKPAIADINFTTTGGSTTDPNNATAVTWFDTANWDSTTVQLGTGTLPESYLTVSRVQDIIAPNTVMPSVGVVFDPKDDPNTPGGPNANYVANLDNIFGTFYIASVAGALVAPNKLTIESGTIIAGSTTVGRDAAGILALNGGTFITTQEIKIQGQNKSTNIGTGTFEYHGGNLLAPGAVQVASGGCTSGVSLTSAGVGYFVVYNDGPDGAMLSANGFEVAINTSGIGSIGIVEFHYDKNTGGIGGTRPVQSNWNNGDLGTNAGILRIQNNTNLSARLNLVLDTAPSIISGVVQNLGLFDETQIQGQGTYPQAFYSVDGHTVFTQGATISAAYANKTYSWTISYSGQINFSDTATSAYNSTGVQATGGSDVVLIGVPVPEPGGLALIGGIGSMILSRRRRRTGPKR